MSPNTPDAAALAPWLAANVPGFRGPARVEPLAGGQSNPTFRLSAPSGEYVLRRKPLGPLLRSAHMVEREFRVMQALGTTDVPVPRVHALCEDPAVIGSTFFVMDFVPGRTFMDPRLAALAPDERAAILDSMNETVARLHAVDPDAVGLGDYGRPANYMQRQFKRWSEQFRASETVPIPAMERLIEWLPAHLPASAEVRIVHGDLRLDNMLIHPQEPRVVALLDWELSTLGDPLADFANNTLAWWLEPEVFRGLKGAELPGIPTGPDYVAAYNRRSGRSLGTEGDAYVVFGLFRLAAIIQGIARRSLDGTATDPEAATLGRQATPIAEAGWRLAERLGR